MRVLARLDSCSAHHSGEPSGLIVCASLESFKLHVSTLQLPLVVLFELIAVIVIAVRCRNGCSTRSADLLPELIERVEGLRTSPRDCIQRIVGTLGYAIAHGIERVLDSS